MEPNPTFPRETPLGQHKRATKVDLDLKLNPGFSPKGFNYRNGF